jgi:hypothetical protein
MHPVLRAGLCNQVIGIQELVQIAQLTKATLCWPRVNLNGIIFSNLDRNSLMKLNPNLTAPFDTLFDKRHFKRVVKQVYDVEMVTSMEDQQLCDFAYSTRVRPLSMQ